MNLSNTWSRQPSFGIRDPFKEEAQGLAASATRKSPGQAISTAVGMREDQTGVFGDYGNELTSQALKANPNYGNYGIDSSDQGFLNKLFSGNEGAYNTVQAGLGIGQLGLGLASYLQQKEMAEKQGTLLDQQISNNKFEMGNRRKMVEAFNNR